VFAFLVASLDNRMKGDFVCWKTKRGKTSMRFYHCRRRLPLSNLLFTMLLSCHWVCNSNSNDAFCKLE
jgi:hypothetical protein